MPTMSSMSSSSHANLAGERALITGASSGSAARSLCVSDATAPT
jgi:hypothetical protein